MPPSKLNEELAEPKQGKPVKITVWKNGDFSSCGQSVLLIPKYLRSWNAVLAFLTAVLRPTFGVIMKLYHWPSTKAVDCFKDLSPNEKYIATGREPLKYLANGYRTEEEKPRKSSGNTLKLLQERCPDFSPSFINSTKMKRRTVIHVMVSGNVCRKPIKVVLIDRDFSDWKSLLQYISYRLDVVEGIKDICTVTGKVISDPSAILHGNLYIVVPFNENFIKMDYLALFSDQNAATSCKANNKRKRSTSSKRLSRLSSARHRIFSYRKNSPSATMKCSSSLIPAPVQTSAVSILSSTLLSNPLIYQFNSRLLDKDCQIDFIKNSSHNAEIQAQLSKRNVAQDKSAQYEYPSGYLVTESTSNVSQCATKSEPIKDSVADILIESLDKIMRDDEMLTEEIDNIYEGEIPLTTIMEKVKEMLRDLIGHCITSVGDTDSYQSFDRTTLCSKITINGKCKMTGDVDEILISNAVKEVIRKLLEKIKRNLDDESNFNESSVSDNGLQSNYTTFAEIAKKKQVEKEEERQKNYLTNRCADFPSRIDVNPEEKEIPKKKGKSSIYLDNPNRIEEETEEECKLEANCKFNHASCKCNLKPKDDQNQLDGKLEASNEKEEQSAEDIVSLDATSELNNNKNCKNTVKDCDKLACCSEFSAGPEK